MLSNNEFAGNYYAAPSATTGAQASSNFNLTSIWGTQSYEKK